MTLDARAFRDAMGCFATGVTVVTARDEDGTNVGCTANSFSSVSLDPPLVLWSIAKNANSYNAFMKAKHFAIHILHSGQEDVSRLFATKDIDKFNEVGWSEGAGGTPLLDEYSVRLECTTEHLYEGGDHIIIVGRVHDMDNPDAEPLGFYQGKYATIVTQ
ncbi:MAG TPA: nitrilotriacetate monooxygenase [Porticoccaceae bacterium]|nr:nitrilotriacetate monooxygenase [Porticoccaceae bacterium]